MKYSYPCEELSSGSRNIDYLSLWFLTSVRVCLNRLLEVLFLVVFAILFFLFDFS